MNFGKVLQVLQVGKLVRRADWPSDAWLMRVEEFTVPMKPWAIHSRAFQYLKLDVGYSTIATHLDLFDGQVFKVGWTPTQEDLVADNWEIIDGEGSTNRPQSWRRDENGNTVPAELPGFRARI